MKKFAVILPWEYNIPSAEKELVDRLIIAASNINVKCILSNRFGFILDEEFNVTQNKIGDDKTISFALHTHFESAKWDDVFSFFTLWNPVSLLFAWNNFSYYTFTYLTYDDYLSNESTNPIKHINYLLNKVGRGYDNDISLFTTCSKDNVLVPNFIKSRQKIFYCGTAWEKSAGSPVRHQNLFKKLEEENILEIYGPRKANGIEPWAGYSSYQGEIPFDGQSIFKKINETGIVLALSSLEHQKAGAVTNRLFEAAAGGSVIITDKNDFTLKYFNNQVLMVDNSGDWELTVSQIINHYKWILSNQEQAQRMALESQNTLKKFFLMETHLSSIFEKLNSRKCILSSQIYAKHMHETIDIILRWDKYSLQEFQETLLQINNQNYTALRVIVIIDKALVEPAQSILNGVLDKNILYVIHGMKIFNSNELRYSPLYRVATTGQMLAEALVLVESDYVAFISSNDTWFSDHLSTLKRILEENALCDISHSSLASKIINNNKIEYHDDYYLEYNLGRILEYHTRDSLSLVMTRKNFLQKINKSVLIYIDYLDFHFLLLNALKSIESIKFSYRKTALKTYYIDQKENPQDYPIVKMEYQQDYIKSLMQFDIPEILKKHYKNEINQTYYVDENYINHIIKQYIIRHLKNPFFLLKKVLKKVFKYD